jgi:hypothetical protein
MIEKHEKYRVGNNKEYIMHYVTYNHDGRRTSYRIMSRSFFVVELQRELPDGSAYVDVYDRDTYFRNVHSLKAILVELDELGKHKIGEYRDDDVEGVDE